jgi:hypothetical protein
MGGWGGWGRGRRPGAAGGPGAGRAQGEWIRPGCDTACRDAHLAVLDHEASKDDPPVGDALSHHGLGGSHHNVLHHLGRTGGRWGVGLRRCSLVPRSSGRRWCPAHIGMTRCITWQQLAAGRQVQAWRKPLRSPACTITQPAPQELQRPPQEKSRPATHTYP